MPKIQVVVTHDDKLLYVGYDRAKAKEIWSSYGESDWLETDEYTVIELDNGEEHTGVNRIKYERALETLNKILDYEIDLKEWLEFVTEHIKDNEGTITIGDIVDGNLSDELLIVYDALDEEVEVK